MNWLLKCIQYQYSVFQRVFFLLAVPGLQLQKYNFDDSNDPCGELSVITAVTAQRSHL